MPTRALRPLCSASALLAPLFFTAPFIAAMLLAATLATRNSAASADAPAGVEAVLHGS